MTAQNEGEKPDVQDEGQGQPLDEGTDWKSEARKWEDRAKANYAQVKTLQDAATAAEQAQGELEQARKRLSELEATQATQERALLAHAVAAEKGVPHELLTGSTRDELEAHADKILAFTGTQVPAGAVIPKAGYQPATPRPDEATSFVRSLFPKDN